ncbi:ATP synthase protein I2 [Desulfocucumis palustris]|uniref:ATP synthase protein I2 n=1 Tax=Desulfocucumis palustris TaxID=1898651 RepID=A0A2L2XHP5_9FIRM|nr:ATP synthase subunit I [Desulfocucumis palustris]GBF35642.1 ATP synthase protein I2 [Desulfocucumis palustris]
MFGPMTVPELDNHLRNTLKYAGFIMIGLCLALILYPGDSLLYGMVIGLAVGIFNSITLTKRIKKLPELLPDAAKKHMKRGLTMRLGLIMIVLFFLVSKLPFVSLFGVGAGLLIPSCISIILSMIETVTLYRQSGEFIRKYYSE